MEGFSMNSFVSEQRQLTSPFRKQQCECWVIDMQGVFAFCALQCLKVNVKTTTNALILQCTDTRHSPTCFGTLKCLYQAVNHAPAAFYPGKDPVPIVQNAKWVPEPVCTGAENLAPPGFDPRTTQPVTSPYTD
jgi:hypothetical protein